MGEIIHPESKSQPARELERELGTVRALLDGAGVERRPLIERLARLEQEQADAERERELVTVQQDEFIAALLEEHEEALSEHAGADDLFGREALAEALAQRNDALTERDEALGRRDAAQARAAKYERERDELRAEVSRLRASLGSHGPSTHPPPRPPSRPPSFHAALPLRLDESELEVTLQGRSFTPLFPAVAARFPPAPSLAVTSLVPHRTPADAPERPATASVFPRESTRPGVGGPQPTEAPPRPSFGPPPAGGTPLPPDAAPTRSTRSISAASLPPPPPLPILKRKPDPTTRPLVDYSLGEGGVASETLEGAKLTTTSSKPPRK